MSILSDKLKEEFIFELISARPSKIDEADWKNAIDKFAPNHQYPVYIDILSDIIQTGYSKEYDEFLTKNRHILTSFVQAEAETLKWVLIEISNYLKLKKNAVDAIKHSNHFKSKFYSDIEVILSIRP